MVHILKQDNKTLLLTSNIIWLIVFVKKDLKSYGQYVTRKQRRKKSHLAKKYWFGENSTRIRHMASVDWSCSSISILYKTYSDFTFWIYSKIVILIFPLWICSWYWVHSFEKVCLHTRSSANELRFGVLRTSNWFFIKELTKSFISGIMTSLSS